MSDVLPSPHVLSPDEPPVRSVERAVHILQAINRNRSMTITQIAKEVRLPYATVYRLMNTLILEGLIEKEATRKNYRPTALSQSLSCGYVSGTRLAKIARPHIEKLTQQIGWPVSIGERVGAFMVVEDSTHALTTMTLSDYHSGYPMPLTASAAGLAYLAFIPPKERDVLLQQVRDTRGSQLDFGAKRSDYQQRLDGIRKAGYATYSQNPHTKDPGKTSSVALPLNKRDGSIGTMTIVFFSSAMKVDEAYSRYKTHLIRTQNAINKDLATKKLFDPEADENEPTR